MVDRELKLTAGQRPNAPALVMDGDTTTWSELDSLADQGADALLRHGARPGDVVALQATNSPEAFAMMFAIARAGMVVVPINTMSPPAEVDVQVRTSGARHVVAPGGIDLHELFAAGRPVAPDVEVDEDDPFWIRFTSGTTGTPRALVGSHRVVTSLIQNMAIELRYGYDDRLLVNAPLAHAAFVFAGVMTRVGGSLHVVPFDAQRLWHEVEDRGITQMFAVPTMLSMALESPGDAACLRRIAVSGSTLAPSLRRKLGERLPHVDVTQLYGASEIGMVAIMHPPDAVGREESVGQVAFGHQVRILDEEGREVPRGEIGTIFVHGPSLCDRWLAPVPASTVRDGWVTAGDMGHLDEDGYLYLADRRSDLVISGGLNVYPAEVENILLQVPGVREAVVVGLPDETWGQRVVAVVTGSAEAAALEAHCRTVLAAYKVPRRYDVLDSLPVSPNGKIRRATVRELLATPAEGALDEH